MKIRPFVPEAAAGAENAGLGVFERTHDRVLGVADAFPRSGRQRHRPVRRPARRRRVAALEVPATRPQRGDDERTGRG